MNDLLNARKERLARDLANSLAQQPDYGVTPQEVSQWHESDLFDWLDDWGFEWDDEQWTGDSDIVEFYSAPGHARWEPGETPVCSYCLRPAAFYTPVDGVLLCERPECHTEFVTTECVEIELHSVPREE